MYAARLIGSKKASIALAKAGVACVACDDPPGKRCGSLTWLITPDWFEQDVNFALARPLRAFRVVCPIIPRTGRDANSTRYPTAVFCDLRLRFGPAGAGTGPATDRPVGRQPSDGEVTGRVVWSGPVPQLPPVSTLRPRPDGTNALIARRRPERAGRSAPTAASPGPSSFSAASTPSKARPWDRPPVTVELHDERPMVRQGDGPTKYLGFVRVGDEITIVSRQSHFHALRARGAAFWTLTLPEPDRPRTRRLERARRR